MTHVFASMTFPASATPPCVRPALREELQAMCCARLVACAQKEEKNDPPLLAALQHRYRTHYAGIYERAWQRENSLFLLASVEKEHVSYHVPDHFGHAVAGFCSMHIRQHHDKTVLFVDNLFAMKSAYPTGRGLMGHAIRLAQGIEAESVMLDATYANALNWYIHVAGFGNLSAEDQVIHHLDKNQKLALYSDQFDHTLERLRTLPPHKNTGHPFGSPRKALDF